MAITRWLIPIPDWLYTLQPNMEKLYVNVNECECESHSVVSDSLQPYGLYSPWNSPGKNTGVGSLSLLQGTFPAQRSNPGLLHCGRILYQVSHKGRPRIVEWVAYPFSSGSSWPRNWTRVFCIAGRLFTNWALREALEKPFSVSTNKTELTVAQIVNSLLPNSDINWRK